MGNKGKAGPYVQHRSIQEWGHFPPYIQAQRFNLTAAPPVLTLNEALTMALTN